MLTPGDKLIGVVSQKDSSVSDPKISDINKVGTAAKKFKSTPNACWKHNCYNSGKKRFEVKDILSDDPYFTATIDEYLESKVHIPHMKNLLQLLIL